MVCELVLESSNWKVVLRFVHFNKVGHTSPPSSSWWPPQRCWSPRAGWRRGGRWTRRAAGSCCSRRSPRSACVCFWWRWICLVECRMCSNSLVSMLKLMEWRHRCSFFLSEFPQKSWFKLKAPGFESALFQAPLAPLPWRLIFNSWKFTFLRCVCLLKRQLESALLWK